MIALLTKSENKRIYVNTFLTLGLPLNQILIQHRLASLNAFQVLILEKKDRLPQTTTIILPNVHDIFAEFSDFIKRGSSHFQ